MRTNLTDRQDEYLSEIVGIWMDYLIGKNDFVQFDEQVKMMETYLQAKDYYPLYFLENTS